MNILATRIVGTLASEKNARGKFLGSLRLSSIYLKKYNTNFQYKNTFMYMIRQGVCSRILV